LCALDTDNKPNQACDMHRALKRHRMLCSALTCAAHSLSNNVIESLRASFHNTPVECFICLKSLDSIFIQSSKLQYGGFVLFYLSWPVMVVVLKHQHCQMDWKYACL